MGNWAPLLVVALVIAGFLALLIIPFYTARLDRFQIVKGGARAEAQITEIVPGRGPGSLNVSFSFRPRPGADSIVAKQQTSQAALAATGIAVGSAVEVAFVSKWPRRCFIDALIRAERGAWPEASVEGRQFFYISCSGTSKMNFGCVGSADLLMEGSAFSLCGFHPRAFRSAVRVLREVALEDVVNVERHGTAIRFEVRERETTNTVAIQALDSADADAIVQRLPTAKTSGYVPVMAENAEFTQSLQEITPKTPVTQALVIANVAVFILGIALGAGVIRPDARVMIKLGTNLTPLTLDGQWWRLLTSMFLHFGLIHIAFNMLALYVNGTVAERIFGSLRYLVIYLLAGLCGSVASLLWHSQVNSAGASGAIFGILGAMIAFYLRKEGGVPPSVLKAQLNSAALFVFYNLVLGASVHVDNAAHLGGLAGGFVMGFLLSRPLQADRATKNWSRQWLIALLIAALAATALAYLVGHKANPSIRSFGGLKLGTTISQLIQSKGQPINRDGLAWVYNSVDSRHDGVISAILTSESNGSVRAIIYDGDQASAPPELPFLRGMSRADVVKLYGPARESQDTKQGYAWILFDNGVDVFVRDQVVRSYGIYDTTQ
jgi:membrane associated rhomboid family serine protease